MPPAKTLGIDLGTTNSCMAVAEGTLSTVIPNREGGRTTPSVVAFKDNGEVLVGLPAKRQAIVNPAETIYSVKRLMGRKFAEPEIESLRYLLPYGIAPDAANGDARVKVRTSLLSPPEVSALILKKLKADAETFLGGTVEKAIITVPAYFNDSSGRPPRMRARSPGWKSSASSTSPPRPRWRPDWAASRTC